MKITLLDLKPTQFSVGMREVKKKAKRLEKLKPKEVEDYLEARTVPVVTYRTKLYIIDHHHMVRACWEAGAEGIYIDLKADLSRLDTARFWETMEARRWAHLYDHRGNGPLPPSKLPKDIRGLKDDPYRSLAWAIRHDGAFDKTFRYFSDFRWADFLRKRVKLGPGKHGFKKAEKQALALAHSAAAARLPGFLRASEE
jgi:hypothetical protein